MNIQTSTEIPFSDLPEGTVTFLFTIRARRSCTHVRDKYAILLEQHHHPAKPSQLIARGHPGCLLLGFQK
jgi:hypothetical protein